MGVTFYGKNALQFISNNSKLNIVYQVIVVWMVYVGGVEQNYFVWSLADFGLGLMTVINIVTIAPLINESIVYLEKYEQKLKGCVKINP